MGLGSPVVLGRLADRWRTVVGDAVAAHARPRNLQAGILTIEVDTPEWATQLRFLEAQIVARVAEAVESEAVTGVQIVVRRR